MAEDSFERLSAEELLAEDESSGRCAKLDTPAHIAAFLKQQELHRDCEQILCDQSLLENVVANYVIVKKILSFLPWQDKLMCKNVCSMWRSAVNTLQKEQIGASDFAISMRLSHIKNGIKLLQSDCFYTEPLAVFAFANIAGFSITAVCEMLITSLCDPACDKEHNILDLVKSLMVIPKTCMLAVKAYYVSYLPLPHSITNQHTITRMFGKHSPFIGGIYIPVIPNVEFQVINVKKLSDIQENFIKTMDKLSETHYVKGALVFVNGSFILQSVDDIIFLNYLQDLQPDVPFALGGCVVDDTVSDAEDMNTMIEEINTCKDIVSYNLISVGLFTVPKNFDEIRKETGVNFDMFSLILESSDWSKAKMESAINEFSKKVPHYEHSVVIKMSCVGRDSKHDFEQNFFRAAFPTTRLVGCYGNGELGLNKPERTRTEARPSAVKRNRTEPAPHGFCLMFSYATVFVYIGWGKITKPAEST